MKLLDLWTTVLVISVTGTLAEEQLWFLKEFSFDRGTGGGHNVSNERGFPAEKNDEFQKFVAEAQALPNIVNPLMKLEVYLVKYFNDAYQDGNASLNLLKANLKWREEWKIDESMKEPFDDLRPDFPMDMDTVDTDSRPLLFVPGGTFDYPKLFAAGKKNRFLTYLFCRWEEISNMAIQKAVDGKDISRYVFIVDLYKYDAIHGNCLECVQLYHEMATHFDSKWPQMVDKMFLVNSPRLFEGVVTMLKATLRKDTQKDLFILNSDPDVLKTFLAKFIANDQMPKRLHYAANKEEAALNDLGVESAAGSLNLNQAQSLSRSLGLLF